MILLAPQREGHARARRHVAVAGRVDHDFRHDRLAARFALQNDAAHRAVRGDRAADERVEPQPHTGLLQHIQHFSVICQKAIVVALCAEGVGTHQHIQFGRLALTQKIQRHLAAALGMLHGCAVHDLVGAAAHIAADQCPRHIDAVFSKAFGDRVAQECCIAEIAGAHLAALLAGDLLITNALQRAARVRAKLARLGRNRYKGAVFKRQRCQNAFPRRGGFGLFGRCFSFSPVNNTGDQRRKQKQQRQHQRKAKPPLRTAARTAKLGMVAVAVRLISHSDLSSPIFSECHFIIARLPE